MFRKLGRRVERFKTEAKTAVEDRADYRCEDCGARFDERRERCPECESGSVVPADRPE